MKILDQDMILVCYMIIDTRYFINISYIKDLIKDTSTKDYKEWNVLVIEEEIGATNIN